MGAKKNISKALGVLIPTGVLGISSALAATQAHAEATSPVKYRTESQRQG